MARGKRSPAQRPLRGLEAGAAVQELLERVYLSLEPDVDLLELEHELAEGLALIASFHPVSAALEASVRRNVSSWLSEMGIGTSPGLLIP